MKIRDFIANLFANLKQKFCSHNVAYTELEYKLKENHRRRVRMCDECGLGKESFVQAEKFLLERDLSTKSN